MCGFLEPFESRVQRYSNKLNEKCHVSLMIERAASTIAHATCRTMPLIGGIATKNQHPVFCKLL